MDRKPFGLLSLFSAAAFASTRRVFGGIPLQRLSPKARRQYKKNHTGSHGTNSPRYHVQARACARALRFKERHGHFATEV